MVAKTGNLLNRPILLEHQPHFTFHVVKYGPEQLLVSIESHLQALVLGLVRVCRSSSGPSVGLAFATTSISAQNMDSVIKPIQKIFKNSISSISEAIQAGMAHLSETTDFPTSIHLYYAIARSLYRGYNPDDPNDLINAPTIVRSRRSPLPVELVILIFEFTGFSKRAPTPELTIHALNPIRIVSHGPKEDAILLHTKPLTAHLLGRLRKMQLETFSMDQGWVGDRNAGSWSWFELAILRPLAKEEDLPLQPFDPHVYEIYVPPPEDREDRTPVRREFKIKCKVQTSGSSDVDSEELRWASHWNPLATGRPESLFGEVFDSQHEVWRHLEVGDVLSVHTLAQFPGWANNVLKGKLIFWERFDPTGLA